MPTETLYLKFRFVWKRSPGDGSTCHCCGDSIWLTLWRPFLKLERQKHLIRPAKHLRFCESCATALREEM